MLILAYCAVTENTIENVLGDAEYSYFFVFRQFVKALEKIYFVIPVTGDAGQLELHYQNSLARGEDCLCLFFSQPHKIPLELTCPVIPVFAWEFDSLPEDINNGMDSDWGWRLAKYGWAITHSGYSVNCVKERIRKDFPVISIPTPVWDDYRRYFTNKHRALNHSFSLRFQGTLIDSAALGVKHLNPETWKDAFKRWTALLSSRENNSVSIEGVVYLSVFNPFDRRKNWQDMLRAFCWEFKQTTDVTLILKLSHKDADKLFPLLLKEIYKLSPFLCRVLVIHGYFEDDFFSELIRKSDYVVNASHGEGQCLPLMEGMSAGKPAISPDHTAMRDYLDPANAFIVKSSLEPTFWPHDPKQRLRALCYRINWKSLCEAFRKSYRLIKEQPEMYDKMSLCAYQTMAKHCSQKSTFRKIKQLVAHRQREYKSFDQNWLNRMFSFRCRVLMSLRFIKRRLTKFNPQ